MIEAFLMSTPQAANDDQSALVQLMTCCNQASIFNEFGCIYWIRNMRPSTIPNIPYATFTVVSRFCLYLAVIKARIGSCLPSSVCTCILFVTNNRLKYFDPNFPNTNTMLPPSLSYHLVYTAQQNIMLWHNIYVILSATQNEHFLKHVEIPDNWG